MYNTKRAEENVIVSNDSKYLDAGIHDSVKVEEASVRKSPTDKTFLEIKFTKDGKVMTHTEWEARKRDDETMESYEAKCDRQVSRMLQILKCFYSKESLVFTGSSFKEFVDWVAAMINAADKSKLVKVKIVYNDSGYTTLPKYSAFQFIEPMILPEGETSKIAKLGIDLFERPIVADKEQKENNPLESSFKTIADAEDELPF